MTNDVALESVRLFVALLAGAVAVAFLARRLSMPYSVGLVLVGLVVTRLGGGLQLEITPGLVLAVLLPGLIFEAALRTPFEELRPSFLGVLLLAVPGVVLGAWLVGVVLSATTHLSFGSAFLVGAMVAATDPAAVIATFARMKAPRRLATFVEAESLLNDGTGVVLFTIGLAALTGGSSFEQGVLLFVIVVIGSVALGIAAGFLATRLIALTDEHLVELTISVVLAYGTYLVADAVHLSGIIAAVLAGATLGSYGRTHGLSREALDRIDDLWEFIAYLLTALIFLLLGTAISLDAVAASLVPILWAIVAVLVARALVVYLLLGGASGLAARLSRRSAAAETLRPVPLAWLHILFWAGLRGAVAVALALSIPADTPDHELLQGVTFGVVLFTLIVQGSTAGVLIERLGIRRLTESTTTTEEPASLA
jgi:CPA1 family monovalent cation:H+ antiporter